MRDLIGKMMKVNENESKEDDVVEAKVPFDQVEAMDILMKHVDSTDANDMSDLQYSNKEEFIAAAEQYFMQTDSEGNDYFDERAWEAFNKDMKNSFESKQK